MRKETREKRLVEREILTEYIKICDLCGFKVNFDNETWISNPSELIETEIKLTEIKNPGEYSYRTFSSYDICHKCFKEKLMLWLENQGAKANVRMCDW